MVRRCGLFWGLCNCGSPVLGFLPETDGSGCWAERDPAEAGTQGGQLGVQKCWSGICLEGRAHLRAEMLRARERRRRIGLLSVGVSSVGLGAAYLRRGR